MHNEANKVPLDLIDDPQLAMRTDVHNDDIDELKADMERVGLIEPIVLRIKGERYEIIAGHRRTTAARLLNWSHIEAKIIEADDDKAFQMRVIENISRHDVDPVDEAIFIATVMERGAKTIDDMAQLLRRSTSWVEQRLEVFNMPDYLQTHIKHKRISLGAALHLAEIESENDRRYYCNYAALNGVSVSTAKRWSFELNSRQNITDVERQEIIQDGETFQVEQKFVACARCGNSCPLIEADQVWVHRRCPESQE